MTIGIVEDGYIKYEIHHTQSQPLEWSQLKHLDWWRTRLFMLTLIGAYPNHVGYGNISIRIPGTNQFIISGTATGNITHLNETHYSIVTAVDLAKNTLWCTGPTKASSEAMTHYALYSSYPHIGSVIHIHNLKLWESLFGKVPTTAESATYGTPQMGAEIITAAKNNKKNLIVMGGHKEGLLAFGKTVDEAGEVFVKLHKKYKLALRDNRPTISKKE